MAIKSLLATLATFSSIGAAPPPAFDQQAYERPETPWRDIADAEQRCRDRINQTRAEAGKPPLERGPATPQRPPLTYAVDTRVEGCGVLDPVDDPSDLRPVPEAKTDRIVPAR